MEATCPYCKKLLEIKNLAEGVVVICRECNGRSELFFSAELNLKTADVSTVVILKPLTKRPYL